MRESSDADTRSLVTLRRLQAAYGDAVTRRDWPAVAELFAADAVVRIDTRQPDRAPIELAGPQAVVDFVGPAIARFTFFEFAILNTVVELGPGPDDATGRVYLCELRAEPDGAWTQAFGVYHDRYRRTDGDWRIAGRQYHSLARLGLPPGTSVEAFAFPGDVPSP